MPELVEGTTSTSRRRRSTVKIGNQELYVEKESQFEELVRERVKDMEVADRAGTTFKLTETRYKRFTTASRSSRAGPRGCAPTTGRERSTS